MQKTKWEKLVQKYLFLYKDGFFELPYLSNSPEIMYNSVIENPVTQNKPLEQGIYSNNPFCKGVMYYRKIENNFWVLPTHIEVKQNIIAKAIYEPSLPSTFYVLSFSKFFYDTPIKNTDGSQIQLESVCWTLYKPKTEVETYFFKNTSGKFYNFIFTKDWIIDVILKTSFEKHEHLLSFFDDEVGFYTWLDIAPKSHELTEQLSSIISSEKNGVFDIEAINNLSKKIITEFFANCLHDARFIANIAFNNSDYAKIAKAEKTILLNLAMPFPGVEKIAADVNLSATKLKANFKIVFGYSMLQYHKEKNMLIAMQLIQKSKCMIQIIGSITGFESSSKFTAAFKKRFRKLPSAYR